MPGRGRGRGLDRHEIDRLSPGKQTSPKGSCSTKRISRFPKIVETNMLPPTTTRPRSDQCRGILGPVLLPAFLYRDVSRTAGLVCGSPAARCSAASHDSWPEHSLSPSRRTCRSFMNFWRWFSTTSQKAVSERYIIVLDREPTAVNHAIILAHERDKE